MQSDLPGLLLCSSHARQHMRSVIVPTTCMPLILTVPLTVRIVLTPHLQSGALRHAAWVRHVVAVRRAVEDDDQPLVRWVVRAVAALRRRRGQLHHNDAGHLRRWGARGEFKPQYRTAARNVGAMRR